MVAHFARRRVALDEVDLFLRDLTERIERVKRLLYQSDETSFVLVSIPEAMSVRETKRYFESLQSEGVAVTDLVVNRVEETHADCSFCRARVVSQRPWLKEMKNTFKGLRQHEVPLQENEVRGVDSLLLFGRQIWEEKSLKGRARVASKRRSPTKTEPALISKFAFGERRIWIFGGKGGVGKTTAAAAYALLLAKTHSKQKVLLFSSDPAHSLSDSFDKQIGPLKKGIGGVRNLDAMEIDPGKWFEDLKQRYLSLIHISEPT